MTNIQHNQFDMIQGVQHYLNDNITILNTNIPAMAVKTLLDEKIEELMAHLGVQLTKTTGIAAFKQSKRTTLIKKTLALSAAICAYANISENTLLYKDCHFTKSRLTLMSDFNLSGTCRCLVLSLENYLASLLPFGVGATNLLDYENAIDAFAELINKPTEGRAKRNKSTRAIAKLLSEMTILLKERLDHLMFVFETTQPHFVSVYRHSRRVGKAPTRALDLVVKIVSTTSQQPIEKAKLKIKNKKGFRFSSKNGRNLFSNLKQGPHQLTVTHPNYKPKTIDFTIVDKETTKIVVALEENEIGTQMTQI